MTAPATKRPRLLRVTVLGQHGNNVPRVLGELVDQFTIGSNLDCSHVLNLDTSWLTQEQRRCFVLVERRGPRYFAQYTLGMTVCVGATTHVNVGGEGTAARGVALLDDEITIVWVTPKTAFVFDYIESGDDASATERTEERHWTPDGS